MANGWVYSSVLAAVILILVLTQIFVDFEYEISSTKGIYVKITRTNLKLDNTTFENADFEFKDSFCTINTTAGYIPVFSAHLDNITEDNLKVRIIGSDHPSRSWDSLHCTYFDSDKNHIQTEPARKVNSSDGYNLGTDNSLTFFLCDLWDNNGTTVIPYYVGLISSVNDSISTKCLKKIHYQPNPIRFNVSACVQPLHSLYENPIALLEWIEFHRLMGVGHFTFYNFSIGPVSSAVLASYDPGVVSVLNWNMPKPLRTYGQFVAATDCAHRYRGASRYVMTFDTDEFLIIPEPFTDYFNYFQKLWKFKENKEHRNISFVKMASKLSFTSWSPSNATQAWFNYGDEYQDFVQQLSIPWRSDYLNAVQEKFVMGPDRVIESGVHWAEVQVNGTINISIPRKEGFYLHFRGCDPYFQEPNPILENNATCLNSSVAETDADPAKRFATKLGNRIIQKLEESDGLKQLVLEYVEDKLLQNIFT